MYLETFYTREPVPFLNPQTLLKSPKKKLALDTTNGKFGSYS